MERLYSFDVFDTVLTRPFLRPADLFVIAGAELATYAGRMSSEGYASARRRAESLARERCRPRDDCRFDDIYTHFAELSEWEIDAEVAKSVELRLEGEVVRPIVVNVDLVRKLMRAGEKVVFLSDMYLPREFIWELLCNAIGSMPRENVFVSGDLGMSKHSGRMFRYVLDRYSIEPGRLVHVGDNRISDVIVPKSLGIDVRFFAESAPTLYERLPSPRKRAPLSLSGAGGSARASRLGIRQNDDAIESLVRIACGVVGPILVAFVAWVLRDARRRGLDRLYFVSRDGQIFYKIASLLRSADDPHCRYLYGSRHAWLLPSVVELNTESLSWAWPRTRARTLGAVLRRLSIDTPDVRGLLKDHGLGAGGLEQQLEDEYLALVKALLKKGPLGIPVMRNAQVKRESALKYFEQEGLFDDIQWALVDIGWILEAQRALGRILTAGGRREPVRGYYFGVSRNHVSRGECGPFHAFVSQQGAEGSSPLTGDWLFKLSTIAVIEHLFTVADHPTVQGYRLRGGKAEPIFSEEDRGEKVTEFARLLHEAVLAYADEALVNPFVDLGSSFYGEHAFSIMKQFCLRPEPKDVQGVAWLPTNMEQTHNREYESRLASPLSFRDLFRMVRHELRADKGSYFSPKSGWLEGSAAISTAYIRWLQRGLVGASRCRRFLGQSKA